MRYKLHFRTLFKAPKHLLDRTGRIEPMSFIARYCVDQYGLSGEADDVREFELQGVQIMLPSHRRGGVNVRVLLILIGVVALTGGAVVGGHYIRKAAVARDALRDGLAAYEKQDWRQAAVHLRRYLKKKPNDVEILKKYAFAELSVSPLERGNVANALGAYRRLMRERPSDDEAYEQLGRLYAAMGNFSELIYIAEKRLEQGWNARAKLWQAVAHIGLRKRKQAKDELEQFVEEVEERKETHLELIDACYYLSWLEIQDDSTAAREAITWLSKAVEYAPESAAALINRAKLRRTLAADPSERRDVRQQRWDLAIDDLQHAEKLNPSEPQLRLALSREWLQFGNLERAAAQWESVLNVAHAEVRDLFLEPDDWTLAVYVQGAELALRARDHAQGARLADEVLAALQHMRQRGTALPAAVKAYLLATRVTDARRCLDEYLEAISKSQARAESREALANLNALVARAEDNPYAVINHLELVTIQPPADSLLLRTLAEAYSRTNQVRRAITTLLAYHTLRETRGELVDREAIMQLAREYIKNGDWSRAYEAARTIGGKLGTSLEARLLRIEAGTLLQQQSQTLDPAAVQILVTELVELQKENPKRVEVRMLRAMLMGISGKADDVERTLQTAVRECDEPLAAELMLSRHYLGRERLDDAIESARGACELHADQAAPWKQLADLHKRAERYDQAKATLAAGIDAITAPREKQDLRIRLALLQIFGSDRAAGIDLLREIAVEDATNVPARELLLNFAEVLRNRDEAQRLVAEIKDVQGSGGLAWRMQKARVLLFGDEWRERHEEAAKLLEHCVQADPAWDKPVEILGRLFERLGFSDRAETLYGRFLAINSRASTIADRLLILLERSGRFGEARKVLSRMDADPRTLSSRRVVLAIREGRPAEAIRNLRARIAGDPADPSAHLLLARLVYQHEKDTDAALAHLDKAETLAPGSLAIFAVRTAILRADGRIDESRRLLDQRIADAPTFNAYLVRALHSVQIGELEAAERDYTRLTQLSKDGSGHEMLGQFYIETDRIDDALATWEQGIETFPDNLDLKRRVMRARLARSRDNEDRDRAVLLLTELTEKLPNDADVMWVRALVMFEQGGDAAIDDAEQLLKRAVTFNPTHVDAHLALIALSERRGNYQAARTLAIRALSALPANAKLTIARAEAERALGNVPVARELIRLVLDGNPAHVAAFTLLTEMALIDRDKTELQSVRRKLAAAAADETADEALYLLQARTLLALDDLDGAIEVVEDLRRTRKGALSFEALLTLAELLTQRGDFPAADTLITEAFEQRPGSGFAVRARVSWLAAQKQFDQVYELVSGLTLADESSAEAVTAAAAVLATTGAARHQQRAFELFEKITTELPQRFDAWHGLALLAYQTGDAPRAIQVYERIRAKRPADIEAINNLAWILADTRHEYGKALELADRGVALDPNHLNLRDTRGEILTHVEGRLADARADFEKCEQLAAAESDDKGRALFKLGRVCAQLGDQRSARQHLLDARELDRRLECLTPAQRDEIDNLLASLASKTGT